MSPGGAIFVPSPPETGTNLRHPRHPQSLNDSLYNARARIIVIILQGVAMHYTLLRGYVMFRSTRPFLQSSLDEYCLICLVLSSLGIYRRPCVSPINAPLLVQYVLHNLSKALVIPSGEGVSTH